jgi:putative ABC transport system ATP-binding protein
MDLVHATPNSQPAVELRQVSKVFRQGGTDVKALDNVSLAVPGGRFLAVMGASGSGKSTMLHLIAGLSKATAGAIRVGGRDITAMDDDTLTRFRRDQIGVIFQAYNLLPTMTALENVCLPSIIRGRPLGAVRPEAERLLRSVGLGDRANHRPDELSGGQQQRVAIIRALINQSPLLLADEPTGNLDSKTGEEVLFLLNELAHQQRLTVLMVTHDHKAAAYADQVITLSDGQVIEQVGAGTPAS